MRWLLLLAVLGTAHSALADPYAGQIRLKGDLHRHNGSANYMEIFHEVMDPNDYPACPTQPPNSVHAMGDPASICRLYRDQGFHFVALTNHWEKYCQDPNCSVDGRPGIFDWWKDPNHIGLSSAHPLEDPEPLRNNPCGFRDYLAADPNTTCVDPPWDEIKSHQTAAQSETVPGTFVCLHGGEWNGGVRTGVLAAQCLAGDGGIARQMGHLNLVYPAAQQSKCVRCDGPPEACCPDEEAVYAEAASSGALVINNHPHWGPGEDPIHCACESWVTGPGCDSSFVPHVPGVHIGGMDDTTIPITEIGGLHDMRRYLASVLLLWNRGFDTAIAYGSDYHGRCEDQGLTPTDPELSATVVWGNSITPSGIIDALRSRRTYVIDGFADDGALVKFWFEDGVRSAAMGESIEILDGTASIHAEVRADPAYVALSPGHAINRVQLLHNHPDYADPAGVELFGQVVKTCSVANPGPGCTCSADPNHNGCTIDWIDESVTPGWYYLRAVSEQPTVSIITSAIWVNRCEFIDQMGTGVPCASGVPLLPVSSEPWRPLLFATMLGLGAWGALRLRALVVMIAGWLVVSVATPAAGADPFAIHGAAQSSFQITVFASGLHYPTSMQQLEDGSLIVVHNPPDPGGLYASRGEVVRLVDADADGIADGPASVLTAALPGLATSVRVSGDLVFVSAQEPGDEGIYVFRRGALPADAYTLLGTLDFTFPFSGDPEGHANTAVAVRPTPGMGSGFTDVFFGIGSETNLGTTTTPFSGGGLLAGLPGASAMNPESIYKVTIEDTGGTPVASNLVQVATGLRNPGGIAFHPTTGDLYASENGAHDPNNFNEPVNADELNRIALADIGGAIEDFGFPDDYVEYRTGTVITGTSVQPVEAFQPVPDPYTGAESEGASEIAFAPPSFPLSIRNGVFTGFHGRFFAGGIANDENAVVFHDLSTGQHVHFIRTDEPALGHPNGLLTTTDALFLADLSSSGDVNTTAALGVIYKIRVLAEVPAFPGDGWALPLLLLLVLVLVVGRRIGSGFAPTGTARTPGHCRPGRS